MSLYRDRTTLDDAIITNGDGGFIGFNSRVHPTQLPQGIAQFARNIRFENRIAKVRKGIDRITADTATADTAFDLNFTLGSQLSVASITRSGSTATLTLASTPVVEFTNGDSVLISGANEAAYNGEFTITKVSATVFTYTVVGTPTTPATGTIKCGQPLGEDAGGVFASCMFSDVDTNDEYIALAKEDKVTLIDPDNTGNPIQIEYAAADGSTVTEELLEEDGGSILQVGNGLLLHRGTRKVALEWDGNVFNTAAITVDSITRSSNTATVTTTADHSYKTGDRVVVSGANQSDYNITATITVTTSNTFTYTVANTPTTPATGTIIAQRKPQFKPVANTILEGFMSLPKSRFSEYHPFARLAVPVSAVEFQVSNLSASGNVATARTTINHGLQIGDRFEMINANDVDFNGIFSITKIPSADTFEYVVSNGGSASVGGSNKKAILETRDMFIMSDIFDHRTYDPVNNIFRINRGKNDNLVALKTWQNDNLIALYEKSVHVITGISLPTLENSEVWKITDEVGCAARKTVEIIGDNIVFLSDDGVYMLGITPELNLRGNEVPLSEAVKDQFDESNINYNYIKNSVAVYFNNRYYIALPASGSTRNNIIYVYNFLNQQWESKDTFGSANYIDDFIVCKKNGKDRLFITSKEGSIQLYEELDHDELGSVPTNTEIPARLTTRRYTMGNQTSSIESNPFSPLEVNRFIRASINLDVLNGDAITVTANTENPDSAATIATYTFASTEDHLKRPRINKRGTGCDIQIDSTAGRPTIRSISIEGTEIQRSNKTFS